VAFDRFRFERLGVLTGDWADMSDWEKRQWMTKLSLACSGTPSGDARYAIAIGSPTANPPEGACRAASLDSSATSVSDLLPVALRHFVPQR